MTASRHDVAAAPAMADPHNRVLAWGFVLVGLQLAGLAYVVGGGYFFQDDFVTLARARDEGLGLDYLLAEEGDRVEPASRALMWLVAQGAGTSFVPAAVLVVVLHLCASLLLLRALDRFTLGSAFLLVPLTLYLFTPISLPASTYLSAALPALSVQVAFLVLVNAVLAPPPTRALWWAASLVAHAWALLSSERALWVLPVALAVRLLLLSAGDPWRQRFETIRASWRFWASHAALVAAYLALYLVAVDEPFRREGDVVAVLRSLTNVVVPGLLGGPWHDAGAEGLAFPELGVGVRAVCFLLLLGLIAASWCFSGTRALEAWALLAVVFLLVPLVFGLPGLEPLGPASAMPLLFADLMPLAALALAGAFRGLHDPSARPTVPPVVERMRSRMTLSVVPWAVAALATSSLLTTLQLAPRLQHEYAANFTNGVTGRLGEFPGRAVLNTQAPPEVAARADLDQVTRAVGVDYEFDRAATQMYIFDGLGAVRLLDLFPGAREHDGPEPPCGWTVRRDDVGLGTMPAGERGAEASDVRILRLTYASRHEVPLVVTVGERSEPVRLAPGLGTVFVPVNQDSEPVRVRVDGSTRVCVTTWAVGLPWVAASG